MGSLKPEQGSGGGLPWHELHSRPSSLQLLSIPLSYRCWLPSSAVLPASWLVLCWQCCCWPLKCWVGFPDTLFSSQSLRLPGRSGLALRVVREEWLPSSLRAALCRRAPAQPAQPSSAVVGAAHGAAAGCCVQV